MVLRSVGVSSCGKVMGCLYALMGLLLGAMVALVSVVGGLAGHAQGGQGMGPMMVPMFLGAGAIVIAPIMYGICGFVGGIVAAALYNFVAAMVGGIELSIDGLPGSGASSYPPPSYPDNLTT